MDLDAATYQAGFEAGYADGCLVIDNPAGVNGHTLERFLQIRQQYETAIMAFWPTPSQRGYAAGFDQRAEDSASAREAATPSSPL